jgi:broad specificity phosphatase PhoE
MELIKLIKLANKAYVEARDDEVALIHKLINYQFNITFPKQYKKAEKFLPTVVLIRHGETILNSTDKKENEKLRGWLDTPLNDVGHIQAEKLGHYFYNLPVARIVASDLCRATDTAKAIARHTNAALTLSADLRPFDMGSASGKSVKEYLPILLHHIHNDQDVPPDGSENFSFFLTRTLNVMKTLMAEALLRPQKGIVMAVAHSRNSRAFRDLILSGGENITEIEKKTLLQEEDPVKPGHFMTIQHNGSNWEIVQLPNEELLDN